MKVLLLGFVWTVLGVLTQATQYQNNDGGQMKENDYGAFPQAKREPSPEEKAGFRQVSKNEIPKETWDLIGKMYKMIDDEVKEDEEEERKEMIKLLKLRRQQEMAAAAERREAQRRIQAILEEEEEQREREEREEEEKYRKQQAIYDKYQKAGEQEYDEENGL